MEVNESLSFPHPSFILLAVKSVQTLKDKYLTCLCSAENLIFVLFPCLEPLTLSSCSLPLPPTFLCLKYYLKEWKDASKMKAFAGIKAFVKNNCLFQNKVCKHITVQSKSLRLDIAEDLYITITSGV